MPIDELNPSLGWRGIRFALDNPAVLATQLRAMLRANQGLGNLRVMLPMVSDVSDVYLTHRLLQDLADELSGTSNATLPPLGIMIEVPGIVPLLPHLANHLQFVSVGTNDLTQYLLAVDRGNQRVSARFQTLHPGVLHALRNIVTVSRNLDLEISMCGEMAADPIAAVLLVGMGVDALSMSAFSLPKIRALIRELSLRDAAMLLERALAMQDAQSIRRMVEAELSELDLQTLWESSEPSLNSI
jgi:signal transduction protein with GAF and PtsI domain